jgi:hypothetical protein
MGFDQYGFDDGWSNNPADDEFDLVESISPGRSKASAHGEAHLLLVALASSIETVTRLDTLVSVASPDVATGLRARMAFKEAAGWLGYSHVRIHERDLALRASHHTSSYSAAALRGDVRSALPNTVASEFGLDIMPDDILVNQALRLAQLWPRMAEIKTWSPLADAETLRNTLKGLAWSHDLALHDVENWLVSVKRRSDVPALLRAAAAARSWGNLPGGNPDLTADGMFLAASVFKQANCGRAVPLPFWSAPNTLHNRLSMRVGQKWTESFLQCVSKAAMVGLTQLEKLLAVEARAREIGRSARAKLPIAIGFAIRSPVITAKSLATAIKMTPQAASVLVNEMEDMGLLQEATKRKSWRAFVVK